MSNPPPQPDHAALMHRALRLAHKGIGRVEPNPMVGCVLVKKNRIVGQGYHRLFGGDHAEVWAIKQARTNARNATAYVTLEPCNHTGKTPPCTEALIKAGVSRVYLAMRDPNPLVAGRGLRALQRAGVDVSEGLLRHDAELLNAAYIKLQTTHLPYVIAKWAQSIDGKIANAQGESKWISSAASRRFVHRIRSTMDGIIVGSETVLKDDPLLTCRTVPSKRVAQRIVLDTRLRTPLSCRLVRSARKIPTTIFTSRQRAAERKAGRLVRDGVHVESVPLRQGHVSPLAVLKKLARLGMTNVLIEGGGEVLSSFFGQQLVDEVYIFVAPKLLGGHKAPLALTAGNLGDMLEGQQLSRRRLGPDLLYHFRM